VLSGAEEWATKKCLADSQENMWFVMDISYIYRIIINYGFMIMEYYNNQLYIYIEYYDIPIYLRFYGFYHNQLILDFRENLGFLQLSQKWGKRFGCVLKN
jgi:hypothetical protein